MYTEPTHVYNIEYELHRIHDVQNSYGDLLYIHVTAVRTMVPGTGTGSRSTFIYDMARA